MTFTPVWNKYLPVVRLLMKKALVADQALDMNSIDFHKYGASRKAGYKFRLVLSNGKVENMVNTVTMAKELAAVLLEDQQAKELAQKADYEISMNTKFQLSIKATNRVPGETTPPPQDEASTNGSSNEVVSSQPVAPVNS